MLAPLFGALAVMAAAHDARALAAKCRNPPLATARPAAANENRARAGTLRDGALTVHLVARPATWYPDGVAGCGLAVNAFAEEGKPTQIPGPLIRVTAGTMVRVSVRNSLSKPIWMRGFQDRSARTPIDSVELLPNGTHEFSFVPRLHGAWYYWAGPRESLAIPADADGQLVGALVVDSVDTAPNFDRVLVLTRWKADGAPSNVGYQLNAFNGRSWPATERLTYTVGDSIFWQVINASNATHEMHLHGFFFNLNTKGFVVDSGGPGSRRGAGGMRVTAVLRPGEWLQMSWSPDRAGHWLYHCHLLTHMSANQRLDRQPGTAVDEARHGGTTGNHAIDDMGGLVMGVDVLPKRGVPGVARADSNSSAVRRSIALFANTRPRTFGDQNGYGFVLQEGPRVPASDSIRIPGSPLMLTKGEPVRIAVHNRTPSPISVHWHGIELESYFDGVGGFSGSGRRLSPMIAPRDSFIVLMTPPRVGTFMYHVHGESGEELASGLYGPLLVVEPGISIDPDVDRTFMFADGGPGLGRPIFVNGTATPDTMQMVVGTTYRLRLLYIGANDVYQTVLRGPKGPISATLLAFDGHAVATRNPPRPLALPVGPGHTFEVAVTPEMPGLHTLSVARTAGMTGMTGPVTTVPILVRAP